MRKTFIRTVACLLVPCLIGEPATAAALLGSTHQVLAARKPVFQTQALMLPLAGGTYREGDPSAFHQTFTQLQHGHLGEAALSSSQSIPPASLAAWSEFGLKFALTIIIAYLIFYVFDRLQRRHENGSEGHLLRMLQIRWRENAAWVGLASGLLGGALSSLFIHPWAGKSDWKLNSLWLVPSGFYLWNLYRKLSKPLELSFRKNIHSGLSAAQMLNTPGLQDFEDGYPGHLSGIGDGTWFTVGLTAGEGRSWFIAEPRFAKKGVAGKADNGFQDLVEVDGMGLWMRAIRIYEGPEAAAALYRGDSQLTWIISSLPPTKIKFIVPTAGVHMALYAGIGLSLKLLREAGTVIETDHYRWLTFVPDSSSDAEPPTDRGDRDGLPDVRSIWKLLKGARAVQSAYRPPERQLLPFRPVAPLQFPEQLTVEAAEDLQEQLEQIPGSYLHLSLSELKELNRRFTTLWNDTPIFYRSETSLLTLAAAEKREILGMNGKFIVVADRDPFSGAQMLIAVPQGEIPEAAISLKIKDGEIIVLNRDPTLVHRAELIAELKRAVWAFHSTLYILEQRLRDRYGSPVIQIRYGFYTATEETLPPGSHGRAIVKLDRCLLGSMQQDTHYIHVAKFVVNLLDWKDEHTSLVQWTTAMIAERGRAALFEALSPLGIELDTASGLLIHLLQFPQDLESDENLMLEVFRTDQSLVRRIVGPIIMEFLNVIDELDPGFRFEDGRERRLMPMRPHKQARSKETQLFVMANKNHLKELKRTHAWALRARFIYESTWRTMAKKKRRGISTIQSYVRTGLKKLRARVASEKSRDPQKLSWEQRMGKWARKRVSGQFVREYLDELQAALPPQEAQILHGLFVERKSRAQVAKELGLPHSSIHKLTRRIFKKFSTQILGFEIFSRPASQRNLHTAA